MVQVLLSKFLWPRYFLVLMMLLMGIGNALAAKQERSLSLSVNTAEILKFSKNVSEVFVANPDIADVQVSNPNSAYVFAKKPGTTTLVVSDKDGGVLQSYEINVTHNLKQLNQMLKSVKPGEDVKAISSPKGIILEGSVTSPQASKDINDIVKRFLGDGEEIVNNIKIVAPTQVYLKVKVAEVNRTVLSKLDINWGSRIQPNHFAFGVLQGRAPIDATTGAFSSGVNLINPPFNSLGGQFNDGKTNIAGLIDILDSESLATVLAEPNLVAMSGETASFLAGGEFPFPVPQQRNITIDFKEFGIKLAFTPTVLSSNKINLRVRPEVSELDRVNQLDFSFTAGTRVQVPGIRTRRVETSVELGSGESLAIAGLFSNNINNALKEVPGLADIPVLGALFRSASFSRNETELVVIVTPYIIQPSSKEDFALPSEGIVYTSQLDTFFYGRLTREKTPLEKTTDSLEGSAEMKDDNNLLDQDMHLIGSAGFYYE